MEIEKLQQEDFTDPMRGRPSISFTHRGVIVINKSAVLHLKLYDKKTGKYGCVSICRDKDTPYDFAIMKDIAGWQLRGDKSGAAVFNSVRLARYVIDTTWDGKNVIHAVGAIKPLSWLFRIALLPLDDDKNCDVYALLRRGK